MNRKNAALKLTAYGILFSLPIVVYFSVVGHEFIIGWDDGWMVLNHYTIGGLNSFNLAAIFIETNQGQYSPVNQLLYTIIYSIFGADPSAFHLANVLYHAINVCLVFAFVKMLLGFREKGDAKTVTVTAFVTALLFAVHPVNTEAVAWISASKAPLFTLFGLLGFICYMKYAPLSPPHRGKC